jgi:hypothetical protein
MQHHPDFVLQIARDIQRTRLDAAERSRLVRTVGTPRRPRFDPRRGQRVRRSNTAALPCQVMPIVSP